MLDLLFNPNGRIDRNRFWQGMVVLTIASILVAAGFRMVAIPLVFLHFALVYPYICVIGKRLHDIGQTAWLVLVVWVAGMVLNQIVSGILGVFLLSPETMQNYERVMDLLERNEVEPAMEGMMLVLRGTVPLVVVTTAIVGSVIAFALGMLPTQTQENKHGPVPGSSRDNMLQ